MSLDVKRVLSGDDLFASRLCPERECLSSSPEKVVVVIHMWYTRQRVYDRGYKGERVYRREARYRASCATNPTPARLSFVAGLPSSRRPPNILGLFCKHALFLQGSLATAA